MAGMSTRWRRNDARAEYQRCTFGRMRAYYVYVMASRSRVLYTGVTNDLARRVYEHKRSLIPGFTSKYRITRLVYFEEFADIHDAIAREKQIKGWVRARKTRLIEEHNPTWEDRADLWFEEPHTLH
jgi:putative endonuclease